jgi:hypothetical protein
MGGMGELLRGGGQIVCEDPARIAESVAQAIRSRAVLGPAGQRYARTFSDERFTREWRELIVRLHAGAADGAEPG